MKLLTAAHFVFILSLACAVVLAKENTKPDQSGVEKGAINANRVKRQANWPWGSQPPNFNGGNNNQPWNPYNSNNNPAPWNGIGGWGGPNRWNNGGNSDWNDQNSNSGPNIARNGPEYSRSNNNGPNKNCDPSKCPPCRCHCGGGYGPNNNGPPFGPYGPPFGPNQNYGPGNGPYYYGPAFGPYGSPFGPNRNYGPGNGPYYYGPPPGPYYGLPFGPNNNFGPNSGPNRDYGNNQNSSDGNQRMVRNLFNNDPRSTVMQRAAS